MRMKKEEKEGEVKGACKTSEKFNNKFVKLSTVLTFA